MLWRMRALLQRVSKGRVSVNGEVMGAIGQGLVILLGAGPDDDKTTARKLAQKATHLRLFPDEAGRMNLSLLEVGGGALVVSQFTLYADCKKGRRPSFTGAAPPEVAAPLVDHFVRCLREEGIATVAQGRFGAHMQVDIHNDGPVTIWLDSEQL